MSDAPHSETGLHEEQALLSFVETTVSRAREGKLDVHNSLASIAIVVTTWAKGDPVLYQMICGDAAVT